MDFLENSSYELLIDQDRSRNQENIKKQRKYKRKRNKKNQQIKK